MSKVYGTLLDLLEDVKDQEISDEELLQMISDKSSNLFDKLIEKYSINALKIIKYIIYGYTVNSPYILIRSNWSTQKPVIAKKVDLPESLYEDVVNLNCDAVKSSIANYLDSVADFDFKHLRFYENMYEKLMTKSMSGGDDDMIKNRKDLQELHGEILDIKDRLLDKYQVVHDNIGEVKTRAKSLNDLRSSGEIVQRPH